eukprot:scaffold126283_cov27-Attheya_sp.AAC.1
MNLTYEHEDESESNNGVDDDLGFEETQQICRDIEKDLCYELDQSKKVWFPNNVVPDDLGFEETQQICRDIEKDLCYDLDQSKNEWFHPDVVTEVRYINKKRSVRQCNASVQNNLSSCPSLFQSADDSPRLDGT